MNRTAPLAAALLSVLAFAATPAHAFGSFGSKTFTVDSSTSLFNTELNCTDGLDNDGDGFTDSADADCDGRTSVPTIDVSGSASPGGDDIMPIPDFFLAWNDDGSDLGLYTLTDKDTDRDGNITYTYDAVVTDLGYLDNYGLLEGMTAAVAHTDADQVDDLVMALPAYSTGLVMAYSDVYAGEQSFYDYTGFLYTSYSNYECSASTGTYTHATSTSYCTTNVAENLMLDAYTGTVLADIGYANYYGQGIGFRWAIDETSLRSGVAEDGGLAYVRGTSVYYY